jgi:hypothetical protein
MRLTTLFLTVLSPLALAADLRVTDLRCESQTNPLAVDAPRARLSWVLESGTRGQRQTAYHIIVASTEAGLRREQGVLWDSGKIESDAQNHIEYAGKPLVSNGECFWKVRVWDMDGKPSRWSQPARWGMGLVAPQDWKAKWIRAEDQPPRPLPLFRREFVVNKPVRRMVVHVCGLGLVNQAGVGSPNYFQYTLRGGSSEEWTPQFSYTGFQYLLVEGAVPQGRPNPHGLPVIDELASVHVRNHVPAAGHFECSDRMFKAVDRGIDWAVRANLAHVLTDCPHREKLGWLEVAYLMGPSIAGRYDIERFYRKVARDCVDSQAPDGLVPTVAPSYPAFSGGFAYTPEWGAASVIVPRLVYDWYGDPGALRASYAAMKGFVDYLKNTSRDLVPVPGLGDWYDYGHGKPVGASQFTPVELSAMATFYRCTRVVADTAALMGKPEEQQTYGQLAVQIRDAFNAHYFDGKAVYRNAGSPQCANSMAVALDMVPSGAELAVLERIVEDIRSRGNQQTAGDIGYAYLVEALARNGRSDVLFDIASRTNLGSYGFIVNNGWTAMPEGWDADTGASMNHCMLGHIQQWFMGHVAGIRPDPAHPGFARFIIAPEPVGDLTWARASYDSIRGRIESDWQVADGHFRLNLTVPPNTRATVVLPVPDPTSVRESGKELGRAAEVKRIRSGPTGVEMEVAAGRYRFEARRRR